MIALDASVLIAHLDPADVHHVAATGILLDAAPGSMLVHTVTLAEVLVGAVKVGRGASLRDDLRAAGIEVAAHDADEPLRLAELRAGSGLKLPDCCVLDVAIRHHASLATFDDTLAAAARHHDVAVLTGLIAEPGATIPQGDLIANLGPRQDAEGLSTAEVLAAQREERL